MTNRAEDHTSSNRFIEDELHNKIRALGEQAQADVLTVIAPMRSGVDDLVRDAVEDIPDKNRRLLVVLETEGGSIEVVERIADLLRVHYPNEVSFLIPSFAMSAGTVLAMSGDNIYMDYYSILGPIDPQVRSRSKGDIYVPALGYLEKYNDFIEKASEGQLTDVEITFFVTKFDPAELHYFEQARDLSIELLKKWLVRYKFKNWTVTQSRKRRVTTAHREKRAAEIAQKLNNTTLWKSHGRGLSKAVLENELKLLIEDFGADPEMKRRVRSYYRLLQDYMLRVRHTLVIHTPYRYLGV